MTDSLTADQVGSIWAKSREANLTIADSRPHTEWSKHTN